MSEFVVAPRRTGVHGSDQGQPPDLAMAGDARRPLPVLDAITSE
jgi:hypothetical protein